MQPTPATNRPAARLTALLTHEGAPSGSFGPLVASEKKIKLKKKCKCYAKR